MATKTTRRKNPKTRPIIVLLDDKDCYPEPLVDGFVMPPIDKSLEEAFDLLEELSERYKQAQIGRAHV